MFFYERVKDTKLLRSVASSLTYFLDCRRIFHVFSHVSGSRLEEFERAKGFFLKF